MKTRIVKSVSILLSVCIAAVGFPRSAGSLPRPGKPAATVSRGAATSDEATAVIVPEQVAASATTGQPLRLGAFAFALAQPDSTEEGFEFPEEEESHVTRDIIAFVIGSAFVAFFIIKVFLEGDTDDPPPDDGGKTIPGQ